MGPRAAGRTGRRTVRSPAGQRRRLRRRVSRGGRHLRAAATAAAGERGPEGRAGFLAEAAAAAGLPRLRRAVRQVAAAAAGGAGLLLHERPGRPHGGRAAAAGDGQGRDARPADQGHQLERLRRQHRSDRRRHADRRVLQSVRRSGRRRALRTADRGVPGPVLRVAVAGGVPAADGPALGRAGVCARRLRDRRVPQPRERAAAAGTEDLLDPGGRIRDDARSVPGIGRAGGWLVSLRLGVRPDRRAPPAGHAQGQDRPGGNDRPGTAGPSSHARG